MEADRQCTIIENGSHNDIEPRKSLLRARIKIAMAALVASAVLQMPDAAFTQDREQLEYVALYKIPSGKSGVRMNPDLSSPVVFYLLAGMEVKPLERKNLNGKSWIRFEIQGVSYWIFEEPVKPAQEFSPEIPRGRKIVIDKARRKLTLYEGNGQEWLKRKEYRIGITAVGGRVSGPKQFEGDGRTPEGEYYVAGKNPASAFGSDPENPRKPLGSLLLNYPNSEDAWRGLQNGLITIQEYERIRQAQERKSQPPQNTRLGNYVMIHGGGGANDWTIGCISMDDEDMKELYKIMRLGDAVGIW